MFAAYVIIFLASLLGNSVIIDITRTDNSLKTTTKCLIMTQAYADLLITFIALPFFLYHRMMKILWFGGVWVSLLARWLWLLCFPYHNFQYWFLSWLQLTIFMQYFYLCDSHLYQNIWKKWLRFSCYGLLLGPFPLSMPRTL